MTERQFYDWQTAGGGGDVLRLVEILERLEIPWCMIGGLAVNYWADEPLATADVDMVLAAERVGQAVDALTAAGFQAKHFDWSVNLKGSSKVSMQISTDEMYREFPGRSVAADVRGILMRVASLEDTLTGKIVAWRDETRRPSKRQKDLLDIMRLVESHSELRADLPPELAAELDSRGKS
ncbi:MAG: nucleotidyl transferase AbiEii/AbiGii toxin family protein [Pirellulales bacterium]